ncbi:1-deoxy-D-xylulose-5-phosphate reductoisomerase, partial [Vibrio furnissii]
SHILLTGSGGPFRYSDINSLKDVTPEQAIAHPNWSMGPKISVDSATMMNKGLEFIEAKWLFNAAPEQLKVLIHPQSVIHSMVQ